MLEYRSRVLHVNGVSAVDLANRFGTPLYVYDAQAIETQIAKLMRAFGGMPFRPFYAMKANGNLAILRLVRQHGFGCDAVSPGEIYLARRAGYEPDAIWFTCSNVSDDDLRAIGEARIVVNVNSISEIERCLALGLPNPMALRINPDVGAGHHRDVVTAGGGVKFGIDLAELETARTLIEDAGHTVTGLHAHIGSGVDDVAPLLDSARILLELAPQFRSLKWVNFGGGIAVPYRPGEAEFPIDEYGRELTAFAGPLLRERGLTAILEPGRYIVAGSGLLLSRVTTRRVSGGADWIGCDTGFNHLARPSKYGAYHHILNASSGSDASLREQFDAAKMEEELVVTGNICESGDVFTRTAGGAVITRSMERTRAGDVIAFCDAGAYGFSMASHYNARLLPAEVLVRGDDAQLIRRRQSYDELLGGME
ncbi:MAG TPA: diaminopimelate decarboxylase [Thermoanaerobaculia bacterium]|nr:diaminopimelate decarboxylase [Thermoanaerobaculia bacterium]